MTQPTVSIMPCLDMQDGRWSRACISSTSATRRSRGVARRHTVAWAPTSWRCWTSRRRSSAGTRCSTSQARRHGHDHPVHGGGRDRRRDVGGGRAGGRRRPDLDSSAAFRRPWSSPRCQGVGRKVTVAIDVDGTTSCLGLRGVHRRRRTATGADASSGRRRSIRSACR